MHNRDIDTTKRASPGKEKSALRTKPTITKERLSNNNMKLITISIASIVSILSATSAFATPVTELQLSIPTPSITVAAKKPYLLNREKCKTAYGILYIMMAENATSKELRAAAREFIASNAVREFTPAELHETAATLVDEARIAFTGKTTSFAK
jgi:hypothetical protein